MIYKRLFLFEKKKEIISNNRAEREKERERL